VPPEQGFDKLSLRGGWEPTDDYLLVQGFGAGQHGHPDANSISQYQAQGRLFLVDSDYIRRMPAQHNMVMVIRDGQHGLIPVTARLDNAFEFSGGAFTQTTLPGYNGCDWQRAILWLRNDCAVVVDTLTALEAGDYELRCYWRTLAETKLVHPDERRDPNVHPACGDDFSGADFGRNRYRHRRKRVYGRRGLRLELPDRRAQMPIYLQPVGERAYCREVSGEYPDRRQRGGERGLRSQIILLH
jgi:hypothetical protein